MTGRLDFVMADLSQNWPLSPLVDTNIGWLHRIYHTFLVQIDSSLAKTANNNFGNFGGFTKRPVINHLMAGVNTKLG